MSFQLQDILPNNPFVTASNQVTALPGFENTSGNSVYVGVATIPTTWYTNNTNLLQIGLGSVTVVT